MNVSNIFEGSIPSSNDNFSENDILRGTIKVYSAFIKEYGRRTTLTALGSLSSQTQKQILDYDPDQDPDFVEYTESRMMLDTLKSLVYMYQDHMKLKENKPDVLPD